MVRFPNIPTPEPQEIRVGAQYTPPTPPAVEGYTFLGYFLDENGRIPFTNGTVLKGDTYLYGKWRSQAPPTPPIPPEPPKPPVPPNPYDIEIVYHYGSSQHPSDVLPSSNPHVVPNGTEYEAIVPTLANNWLFLGWFYDALYECKFINDTVLNESVDLYGKWEFDMPSTEVEIAYHYGGSEHPENALPLDNPHTALKGTYDALTPISREDFDFVAWYYTVDYEQKFMNGTAINENTNLYGRWSLKTGQELIRLEYADFEHPDGILIVRNIVVPLGTYFTLNNYFDPYSNLPSGWSFDGMYLKSDGTIHINNGFLVTGWITIYLKWRRN